MHYLYEKKKKNRNGRHCPTYKINGIKFVGTYACTYFVTAVLLGWSAVDAAILNSFGIFVIPDDEKNNCGSEK